MLTQIRKPKRHLSTYYHDNSLLVQFVLSEFITAYQLTCQIKNLTEIAIDSIENQQHLSQYLNHLLGLAADNERFVVSRWTKGPLTKLNHYCKQFYKNGPHQNKVNLALYTYVHKTWLSALQAWELLHAFHSAHMPKSAVPTLKRSLKHLNTCINQVAKSISRVLSPFSDNENVLFFLFRKKTELEEIYGVGFIDKAFKMSTHDIFQLLTQRYIQRGFDHLISSFYSI